MIRDKLPEKGREERGFRKLFKAITKSISKDPSYSKAQQEFFSILANSTFDNYYLLFLFHCTITLSRVINWT